MKRAIVVCIPGLDLDFIDRVVGVPLLEGLGRLKYRARMHPLYPADPVLASAMHATGVGPGAHGIFQAAAVSRNGNVPKQFLGVDDSSFADRHICRLLSREGVSCLWYRGLNICSDGRFDGSFVGGLGLSVPFGRDAPVLDPFVEPGGVFNLVQVGTHCEIERTGEIKGLKVEPVDSGRRLKISYLGKKMLLERGCASPKLPALAGDEKIRFRVGWPLDGSQPFAIVCDFDPSGTNQRLSQPEELAWVMEEDAGRHFNFGRWAEFEAVKDGLLDVGWMLGELKDHLGLSLDFALSAVEEGSCQFIYVWEESFELARRLASSLWDPNHQRFDPTRARRCEIALIDMLYELDGTFDRLAELSGDEDWLIVFVSDYGLAPYVVGFDLNRWLVSEGYARGELGPAGYWEFDWKGTRAFAVGPMIYINLYGLSSDGVVMAGREETDLAGEIADGLKRLECPIMHERAVRTVKGLRRIYSGRELRAGPSLVVGLYPGYAIAAGNDVFFGNSGYDGSGRLGVDPEVIHGFVMANRKILPTASSVDIFSTVAGFFELSLAEEGEGRCLLSA